ncbi:MAG TPA: hypothetical protein VGW35_11055 [Methylomirabilota bacterium]|nr:hypothetical protein [Methylomirabilota bacterium]
MRPEQVQEEAVALGKVPPMAVEGDGDLEGGLGAKVRDHLIFDVGAPVKVLVDAEIVELAPGDEVRHPQRPPVTGAHVVHDDRMLMEERPENLAAPGRVGLGGLDEIVDALLVEVVLGVGGDVGEDGPGQPS